MNKAGKLSFARAIPVIHCFVITAAGDNGNLSRQCLPASRQKVSGILTSKFVLDDGRKSGAEESAKIETHPMAPRSWNGSPRLSLRRSDRRIS